jgi:nucleotide-binding universal stress UspA family protein
MLSRILVPLDGTDLGDAAIPFATAIARRTGAAIEFVHVHAYHAEEPYLGGVTPYQFEGEPAREDVRDARASESEREWIHGLAARMHDEAGVKVTDRVLEGRVPDALLKEIERAAADFIVMGARPYHGIRDVLDGSVSRALVRESGLPVLLVRPAARGVTGAEPSIRRILVPLDGSIFSEQILEPAVALARSIGASITLYHAISPLLTPGRSSDAAEVELLSAERADAQTYLHSVARAMHGLNEPPRTLTTANHIAANGILEAADHDDFDLIAMTTHGRTGLTKLLAGSTTDRVLAQSHIPMLVLRPRQE